MSLSILILTRNEESNIGECIKTISWCDDVVVLDSFSTDQALEISRSKGARVFRREFDDFASQRNFALEKIEFKYGWVFHLDADERFTPELHEECMSVINQDSCSGFMVSNKLIFKGKWLRWSSNFPVYQLRLVKIGEVEFVQEGHGQRESKSKRAIGKLKSSYLHYNFSKGDAEWWSRHEKYAYNEAQEAVNIISGGGFKIFDIFSANSTTRRRALKKISYYLPCRSLMRFCYMFLFKLGLFDGVAGFQYCRLISKYEGLISKNLRKLRNSSH